MSIEEDIVAGTRCMKCHEPLATYCGIVCDAGHPLYCEECWKKLPQKDRDDGAPYFCEEMNCDRLPVISKRLSSCVRTRGGISG